MLKKLWESSRRLAHRIGTFQGRVVLTAVYFVLVLPFGVAVGLLADPLRIKRRPTRWLNHPDEPADMDWARRQW